MRKLKLIRVEHGKNPPDGKIEGFLRLYRRALKSALDETVRKTAAEKKT
ncbi:MAG: hypothetical protein IJF78_15395 [Clostridia bacterium]|nr:hypothetical protein [Clostridia bacterium]